MERWHHARSRMVGVLRYAHKAGWTVRIVDGHEPDVSVSTSALVRHWHLDGCIVDGDIFKVTGVPVVYCDADPRRVRGRYWGISHDSRASARLAMQELLELDMPNYAFVGYCAQRRWSEERLGLFKREVAKTDAAMHIFPSGTGDFLRWERNLTRWIAQLPRPCGILAANDRTGAAVLNACRDLCIAVPESVAVVGIDNDECICESTAPTMTSVSADYEESGFRAAEMLDEVMSGELSGPPFVREFPVVRIVRRQSTRKFDACAGLIKRALEYIRLNACNGVGAADTFTPKNVPASRTVKVYTAEGALIAEQTGSGTVTLTGLDFGTAEAGLVYYTVTEDGYDRRTLERNFKLATGRTLLDAVHEVRIERAQDLLRDKSVPIKVIYGQCGYADDMAFRRFFRTRTGVSPLAWRSQC